jgi:hypothetical protein
VPGLGGGSGGGGIVREDPRLTAIKLDIEKNRDEISLRGSDLALQSSPNDVRFMSLKAISLLKRNKPGDIAEAEELISKIGKNVSENSPEQLKAYMYAAVSIYWQLKRDKESNRKEKENHIRRHRLSVGGLREHDKANEFINIVK